MSFFKRLQFYLLGVGLGIVLVYFYLRNREMDAWLPEGRVLEQVMRNHKEIGPVAACQLDCLQLGPNEIDSLLEDADVDFEKSEPRKEPCPVYHIEKSEAGRIFVMKIESCRDTASLIAIEQKGSSCPCVQE